MTRTGPINTFTERLLNAWCDASPLDPPSTLKGSHYPHFIDKEAKVHKVSTPLPRSFRWNMTAGLPQSFSLLFEGTSLGLCSPSKEVR